MACPIHSRADYCRVVAGQVERQDVHPLSIEECRAGIRSAEIEPDVHKCSVHSETPGGLSPSAWQILEHLPNDAGVGLCLLHAGLT